MITEDGAEKGERWGVKNGRRGLTFNAVKGNDKRGKVSIKIKNSVIDLMTSHEASLIRVD